MMYFHALNSSQPADIPLPVVEGYDMMPTVGQTTEIQHDPPGLDSNYPEIAPVTPSSDWRTLTHRPWKRGSTRFNQLRHTNSPTSLYICYKQAGWKRGKIKNLDACGTYVLSGLIRDLLQHQDP